MSLQKAHWLIAQLACSLNDVLLNKRNKKTMTKPILEVKNIFKSFGLETEHTTMILEDINFNINSGEIVSILGRSGSGKSTMMRIMSGLIKPDKGSVKFNDELVTEPVEEMAMVFQSFALFPWLTIMENVYIGLEAKGNLSLSEMEDKAKKILDIMGLKGYENFYPRQLSGGMKQRVGFARALVMNPEILLMDEAFSALDVLTAQKLQSDLLDLWIEDKISPNSILMISHNIEETVLLSDRIIVLASNPGHIVADIKVDLEHPRDRLDHSFRKLVDEIYIILTSSFKTKLDIKKEDISCPYRRDRLPKAHVTQLISFMDEIVLRRRGEVAALSDIGKDLGLEINDLMPVTDSLMLLKLIEINGNNINLTPAGKIFVEGDKAHKKRVFAEHLIQYVPIIAEIRRRLHEARKNSVTSHKFLAHFKKKYGCHDGVEYFEYVINWAMFAEMFVYDLDEKVFRIKNNNITSLAIEQNI